MPHSKFWYLHNLQVDQRLPDEVLDTLTEQARLERWGHRADIFRRGDDSDVSVVLEGSVWLQDSRRSEQVALGRGDLFGRANAELEPRELVLRAHDDTVLAVVPREDFREMVVPHLGRLQTRVGLFHKRRDLWVPVPPLLFTTPRSRLAKVLLHLVETEGSLDGERGRLGITLQPRKLADLTGVDRGRLRDVLEAFEREQLLELGRGETKIWDLDKLRQIAQQG